MFSKIIVGTDGSGAAEDALRLACDMAQKYNSELHLVHSPQPQTVAFAMGAVAGYHAATTMPSAKEVQKAGEQILDAGKAVAKECGVKITHTHLKVGDAAEELVAYADAQGADLIVTGRRGLGNLGSLLQGSKSQKINHLAKCACLSTA